MAVQVLAYERAHLAGIIALCRAEGWPSFPGEIQAHFFLIAVAPEHRRRGIARALLGEALARAGGQRIDLVTDSAEPFYEQLPHRRLAGYRIFPPFDQPVR